MALAALVLSIGSLTLTCAAQIYYGRRTRAAYRRIEAIRASRDAA